MAVQVAGEEMLLRVQEDGTLPTVRPLRRVDGQPKALATLDGALEMATRPPHSTTKHRSSTTAAGRLRATTTQLPGRLLHFTAEICKSMVLRWNRFEYTR
jgi:hypothetical protein